MVAIMGASGSGKSTLLNMLAGLDTPTNGQVLLMGQDYQTLSNSGLSRLRNQNMGFVFQGHHLLSEFTAIENVLMPVNISHKRITPVHQQRSEHLLQQVGLAHRLQHKPSELSGGERQRVAIARALMNDPSVVLMDEPTVGLDPKSRKDLLHKIISLKKDKNLTTLWATHLVDEAEKADKIIVLNYGKILFLGKPSELQKKTRTKSLSEAYFKITEKKNENI